MDKSLDTLQREVAQQPRNRKLKKIYQLALLRRAEKIRSAPYVYKCMAKKYCYEKWIFEEKISEELMKEECPRCKCTDKKLEKDAYEAYRTLHGYLIVKINRETDERFFIGPKKSNPMRTESSNNEDF